MANTSARAKYKAYKKEKWNRLTTGEKVLRVIGKIVKWALIIAAIVVVLATVIGFLWAVIVAFAIAGAVGGGFANASNAYHSGDVYVRRW